MSGVVGLDEKGDWVEGTIKDRTTAALKIVSTRLSHIGLDLSDGKIYLYTMLSADQPVVSIQIFLSNYKEDFAAMNEAYIEAFPKNAPMPVRTCIGVANLPAGTDIEMTVVSLQFPVLHFVFVWLTRLFRLRPSDHDHEPSDVGEETNTYA